MNIILLILILIKNCNCQNNIFKCKVTPHKIEPDVHFQNQLEEEYNQQLKSSKFIALGNAFVNPIQIKFTYRDSFTANPKLDWLKSKLDLAAEDLKKRIGIKYKLENTLLIPRYCPKFTKVQNEEVCNSKCNDQHCDKEYVPEFLYRKCRYVDTDNTVKEIPGGPGSPNTDLIMSVSYVADKSNNATVLRSIPCFIGYKHRPIYGRLTFFPGIMRLLKMSPVLLMNVIQHEMFHILGFHSSLYYGFVDSNGKRIIPRGKDPVQMGLFKVINRPRKSVYESYTRTFKSFQMTKTLSYARKYFNCPSLDGVDMEDIDEINMVHFDELIYFYDLMSPLMSGPGTQMTPLSLAFLEDSGWYHIDYSGVTDADHGQNNGCLFVQRGCYEYIQSAITNRFSLRPYCNTYLYDHRNNNMFCSKNKLFKEQCVLYNTTITDKRYIYFTKVSDYSEEESKQFTGLNEYVEYCPILYGLATESDCRYQQLQDDTIHDFLNNYYGEDSRCFINNVKPHPPRDFVGAVCLKYVNVDANSVEVYYKGKKYISSVDKIIISDDNISITVDLSEFENINANSLGNTVEIIQTLWFTILVFISQLFFDYSRFQIEWNQG